MDSETGSLEPVASDVDKEDPLGHLSMQDGKERGHASFSLQVDFSSNGGIGGHT